MKKGRLICTSLLFTLFLSGCGSVIPEMNEVQQGMVVEYAVGTLLKYDKNHITKLQNETLVEQVGEQEEAKSKDQLPDAEAESEEKQTLQADSLDPETGTELTDNIVSEPLEEISIEKFLNIEDIEFQYQGYETVSAYPENEDELQMVMDATDGNDLLVLKFNAFNHTASNQFLDMAGTNTTFKIVINGEEKYALTTMLLNDLVYFNGSIEAGEGIELVLICEIPQVQAAEIHSLAIILKSTDGSATISLN